MDGITFAFARQLKGAAGRAHSMNYTFVASATLNRSCFDGLDACSWLRSFGRSKAYTFGLFLLVMVVVMMRKRFSAEEATGTVALKMESNHSSSS